ncbi:hypothetical protein AB0D27_11300 [Streptomyces sp. NPDC048415]|uniref:hypothetical protein n=1 Tax=Streptomyces sp. NPDC048415 TaxID=3154822 RepID=UPI00343CE209
MSHFPVTVCLPPMAPERVTDALEAALAPYDENMDVEPYRDYIENWQDAYERALKYYTENPKSKPAGLDELDAAAILSAYQGEAVHEETKDGSDCVLFYRESTYNPKSKWDWWVIGGRWLGYFAVKPEHDGDPRLFKGRPGTFDNKAEVRRVDGGPRGLLDFDALRKVKATEAGDVYDRWTALVEGLPEAQPWSHFVERHKRDTEGYTIDRARRDYGGQARVQAARESEDFRWYDDVIDQFAADRATYTRCAAESAVPGYALLDLEGNWIAPGDMGWFGMSSDTEDDRASYNARVNTYLDELPEDAWVVVVDCHI